MLDETTTLKPLAKPEEAPKNGKIRVKLITPLFEIAILEADSVLLPAKEGDILMLPERAPIFLPLRAGRMIVYNKGKEPVRFLISSGVCEFRRNLCPVLAWGGREDKINPEAIAEQLVSAQKAVENCTTIAAKTQVAERIEFFKLVLDELNYDLSSHKVKKKQKNGLKFKPEDLGAEKLESLES